MFLGTVDNTGLNRLRYFHIFLYVLFDLDAVLCLFGNWKKFNLVGDMKLNIGYYTETALQLGFLPLGFFFF